MAPRFDLSCNAGHGGEKETLRSRSEASSYWLRSLRWRVDCCIHFDSWPLGEANGKIELETGQDTGSPDRTQISPSPFFGASLLSPVLFACATGQQREALLSRGEG
jgi:hypothetical protein